MDNALLMSVLQAFGGLHDTMDGLIDGQRATDVAKRRKVTAVDVLHDQIVRRTVHACIKRSNDIGVSQLRCGFHFTTKSRHVIR